MNKTFTIAIIVIVIITLILLLLFFNRTDSSPEEVIVTNFQECIEAGNPPMKSLPRKCQHGNQTFIENID